MKKLLTIVFMAVLAVSAFATVNVETETGLSVYHDGACERVGAMRFIVANIQDYQSAASDNPIYIKIQLTDAAKLCRDIDGGAMADLSDPADGILDPGNYWVVAEVDNAATGWDYGDVLVRGFAGSDYIEVVILDAPGDGINAPNTSDQAWFRFGSTLDITGTPVTLDVANPADPTDWVTTKDNGTPICVDYTGRVGGQDAFMENEFNVVAIETYQGELTGPSLGTSYSPANPAIAYGGPVNTHNFIVDPTCGKDASGFTTPDVYLCQCYDTSIEEQETVYECYDLYREGTLYLQGGDCYVYLVEDAIGMLPALSTITMTVVDGPDLETANPLSTVANGVYFTDAVTPVLTPNTGDSDLDLTSNTGTWGTEIDADFVDDSYSGYVPDEGCVDGEGKDVCTDNYDLYDSVSWEVSDASDADVGTLLLSNLSLARYTADGPITAYVKVSWSPYPCGAGGAVILPYPINFIDCPPEADAPEYWYPTYIYFTYFPALSDGYWWAGAAVTNASYFSESVIGSYHTDQPIDVTMWAIEYDGDMYMLDAGVLPTSGILTTLLSDLTLPWTYLGTDTGETGFGDEEFWLIVEGMPTLPNTWVYLDGFGMIGNGNEGQGTLPRIGYGPWLTNGIGYNK